MEAAAGFDLIVLSEVLYYFDAADLKRTTEWALDALQPQGEVILVHWLGETPQYPLTGDTAAELFAEIVRGRLERVRAERESQTMPDDESADRVRLEAPEIVQAV